MQLSSVCLVITQALAHTGSVVAARGLSCHGACGLLVPQPGIELASPALEGGFLTTRPPAKSTATSLFFVLFFLMATDFNVTVLRSLEERYQGVPEGDHGTCISCRNLAEILQALQLEGTTGTKARKQGRAGSRNHN